MHLLFFLCISISMLPFVDKFVTTQSAAPISGFQCLLFLLDLQCVQYRLQKQKRFRIRDSQGSIRPRSPFNHPYHNPSLKPPRPTHPLDSSSTRSSASLSPPTTPHHPLRPRSRPRVPPGKGRHRIAAATTINVIFLARHEISLAFGRDIN